MATPPLLLAAAALLAQAAPEDDVPLIPPGEELLASRNCTACHAAPEATIARLGPHGAPRLEDVGARVSPAWLRTYLAAPHEAKPGTAMPDLVAGLEAGFRDEAVDGLVHFLASRSGPQAVEPIGVAHPHELEAGRLLFHEVGCVTCHQPQEEARHLEVPWYEVDQWEWPAPAEEDPWVEAGVLEPPAIVFGDLPAKYTVDSLAAFLQDPVAVRPSGRMPSLSLTDDEARDIAMYLLREQAFAPEREPESNPGIAYAYYEADMGPPMPDFDALTPVRQASTMDLGQLPEHRSDDFGFVYSGWIEVPTDGEWSFFTTSDDGSQLWIGGEMVVDNSGQHGMQERTGTIELPAGRYSLRVAMYENQGGEGLQVRWQGPGVDKQVIPGEVLSHQAFTFRPTDDAPFEVDPAKAAEGAEWFDRLGCAACHAPETVTEPVSAIALADLDLDARRSCMSREQDPNVPHFGFSRAEQDHLSSLLHAQDSIAAPLAGEDRLRREMASMNCFVCHRRDEVGGVHPDRLDYFVTYDDVELGDQGRIPPHLEEPGAKLKPDWMRAIVTEGASHRPYMATRMPQFGGDNVASILDLFERLDAPADPAPEPTFDAVEVENGRILAGTKGLGCIQCHTFNGFDSLGVPAVDLGVVHETLQYDWFRKLLTDPVSVDMNTRMPNFWGEGAAPIEAVHDGDPDKQVEALWTYLSLGDTMPLPEGLIVPDAAFELFVADRPRMVGVFMRDVSPRTVCVGFPENVHYAFDVQNSRLAKVWRGRFFNARGTWEGRAGQLQLPPGEHYDLPPGPHLWLQQRSEDDQPTPRVLGRTFDEEGRPSWRYAFGETDVVESVEPFLAAGGGGLRRTLTLSRAPHGGPDVDVLRLAFRLGEGSVQDDGTVLLTNGLTLVVTAPGADLRPAETEYPSGPDGTLVVSLPVAALPADRSPVTVEVEYTW